jgi:hypothetical protein
MTAINDLRIKVDELRRLKENAINAERACGDHEGIVDLLAHQYTDKTHFIFELLQNADDTEATSVEFSLYDDRIEFSHNGTRLFNYDDICSIVAIGKSNKKTNYTKIGKHGIGFKAVFAYTHKPRVFSGHIAFDIVEGRIPVLLDEIPPNLNPKETRFIFPFDTDEILSEHRFRDLVPSEKANSEINQRLQDLSLRTLLFLRHLESIQWNINGCKKGEIIRTCDCISPNPDVFRVELIDDNNTESWIVFSRDVVIDADPADVDDEGKPPKGTVKVAFLKKDGRIVKVNNTELVVYFPTAVKTELGFLIHGPFKTTKARDNIKGLESNNRHTDAANNQIIEYIAQLAADSLEKLCNLNLMNVPSYLALPIRERDFPIQSFFRPVYERVREALKSQTLLLADHGGYIKADEAKLARGRELITLFSREQLAALFGKEKLNWLDAAITERGETADLHVYLVGRKKQHPYDTGVEPLVEGLQVEADTLASKLTADFLKKQKMEWLTRFVHYACGIQAMRKVPFIRLESGEQVALPENKSVSPQAWFTPKDTSGLDLTVFPLVHAELVADETIRNFLEDKGIREINAAAIVEKSILPKFREEQFAENFDEKTYVDYLRCIKDAYNKSDPLARDQLINSLKTVSWLACVHASGKSEKIVWKKPRDTSLFARTSDHQIWFEGLENFGAYFLHPCVTHSFEESQIKSLIKPIDTLSKKRTPNSYNNYVEISFFRGNHKRGLNGFDPDWEIVGLELRINSNLTSEQSVILWNILKSNYQCIKGIIEKSSRQYYENSQREEKSSKVGEFLSNSTWLPDKSGKLRKPRELLLTELPDEFDTTSVGAREVAEKLGMKKPEIEKAADELAKGNPRKKELLELIANASEDELEKFEKLRLSREEILAKQKSIELPEESFANPERRREGILKRGENAPSKESVIRERSIQLGLNETVIEAKAYLRAKYTNANREMVCQCCQNEMPFKIGDAYYFEAVQCVKNTAKHHLENRLALCPTCAAMYLHALATDDAEIHRLIVELEASDDASSIEIPVTLADQSLQLRFVGTHWFDLKTVLKNG